MSILICVYCKVIQNQLPTAGPVFIHLDGRMKYRTTGFFDSHNSNAVILPHHTIFTMVVYSPEEKKYIWWQGTNDPFQLQTLSPLFSLPQESSNIAVSTFSLCKVKCSSQQEIRITVPWKCQDLLCLLSIGWNIELSNSGILPKICGWKQQHVRALKYYLFHFLRPLNH